MRAQVVLIACALNAPLICLLLHAAHDRRWPALGGAQRSVRFARPLPWAALMGWMLAIAVTGHGLALALILPLAALSVAGMVYVPCVRVWPRATVIGSVAMTVAWPLVAPWT